MDIARKYKLYVIAPIQRKPSVQIIFSKMAQRKKRVPSEPSAVLHSSRLKNLVVTATAARSSPTMTNSRRRSA